MDRRKEVVLMAMRCEFIGGMELTKKGKGKLSPKQWRFVNKMYCFFKKNWSNDMLTVLKDIERIEKIRTSYKNN